MTIFDSLDTDECLKSASAFIEKANAESNDELRSEYLELAKQYMRLAAMIQNSPELRSELAKLAKLRDN